jgi:hypothetical protein
LESEHREEEEKKTGTTKKGDVTSRNLRRKKGDAVLGFSGRTALSREQCGVFTPCKKC